jgi:hypothetical protein
MKTQTGAVFHHGSSNYIKFRNIHRKIKYNIFILIGRTACPSVPLCSRAIILAILKKLSCIQKSKSKKSW